MKFVLIITFRNRRIFRFSLPFRLELVEMYMYESKNQNYKIFFMLESFWKSCIFVHFSRFGGRKFAWNFAKIWVLRRCTARSRRDLAVCEERIKEFIDRADIWLLEDSHFLSVRSQAYEHLWSKSKYSGAQLEDLQGLVICSCLATRRWIRKVEMVESERSFFFSET